MGWPVERPATRYRRPWRVAIPLDSIRVMDKTGMKVLAREGDGHGKADA